MVPCVMNKADEDAQWYFYLTEVDVNVSDQFRTLGQPWKGKGIFQDCFWTWQECWDKCVWNKGISWGGVVVMWLLLWNFFLFRCTLSFQISSYVWLMTWGDSVLNPQTPKQDHHGVSSRWRKDAQFMVVGKQNRGTMPERKTPLPHLYNASRHI